MEDGNWRDWEGKQIFVKLRDGKIYSGHVLIVSKQKSNDIDFFLITIKDKYLQRVTFASDQIIYLQEEGKKP